MTLREVARFLRVSPGTVYRLIYREQIPALRFGRIYRFSRAAILRTNVTQRPAGKPDYDAWISG